MFNNLDIRSGSVDRLPLLDTHRWLSEAVPAGLALLDSVAQRLVFSKIQATLGGRMRFLVSGGAPLAAEINEFFHACGLPVLEGLAAADGLERARNAPKLGRGALAAQPAG